MRRNSSTLTSGAEVAIFSAERVYLRLRFFIRLDALFFIFFPHRFLRLLLSLGICQVLSLCFFCLLFMYVRVVRALAFLFPRPAFLWCCFRLLRARPLPLILLFSHVRFSFCIVFLLRAREHVPGGRRLSRRASNQSQKHESGQTPPKKRNGRKRKGKSRPDFFETRQETRPVFRLFYASPVFGHNKAGVSGHLKAALGSRSRSFMSGDKEDKTSQACRSKIKQQKLRVGILLFPHRVRVCSATPVSASKERPVPRDRG